MPLIKSSSEKAFKSNIREMVKAGHPVKQAVAAAYDTQRRAKSHAEHSDSGSGTHAHSYKSKEA